MSERSHKILVAETRFSYFFCLLIEGSESLQIMTDSDPYYLSKDYMMCTWYFNDLLPRVLDYIFFSTGTKNA